MPETFDFVVVGAGSAGCGLGLAGWRMMMPRGKMLGGSSGIKLPPDVDFNIVASPDGRTIYYGAQQVEANIWKVEQAKAVKK